MNEFQQLLSLKEEEKLSRGVLYTPREIAQQPEMWAKTIELVLQQKDSLVEFLKTAGLRDAPRIDASGTAARSGSGTGSRSRSNSGSKNGAEVPIPPDNRPPECGILLSGAGSSEYIGRAVAPMLEEQLAQAVRVVPSTDLVVRPQAFFRHDRRPLIVHFARSGNSPESVAAFHMAERLSPHSHQLCITCNSDGELAKLAKSTAGKTGQAYCLILPDDANDRSLVMTSSFTSMALTAMVLPFLSRSDEPAKRLRALASDLAAGAFRILQDYAHDLHGAAQHSFSRAIFLGDGSFHGIMQECCLKMLEMTEGKIAATASSFLGLRHGPQVFVDENCLVVASLSSHSYARQYEVDLLKELRSKKQGMRFVILCHRGDRFAHDLADVCIDLFPEGKAPENGYRGIVDLMAGQVLATFKCLHLGLKPDNPSSAGTIHRVVEGVSIYPLSEESL